MTFPRRLLADHERLVFDLRPHWVALLGPALWMIAALAFYIVVGNFVDDEMTDSGIVKAIIAAVSAIVILWKGIGPILKWLTTNFVLTSDRLITRHGVIAKNSKEIPLERINDVAFNQSIIERMLGAGDLMIESAGERGQTRISNVRNPEHVQLTIYKEVEENNNRMARPHPTPPPTGAVGDSITDQLEALGRLKQQGVITDMEFETKKQELLKRL